jgi:hypothetical protein
MKLKPEDLAKISDFTLSHYNEHAEDFWEGTRDFIPRRHRGGVIGALIHEPKQRPLEQS